MGISLNNYALKIDDLLFLSKISKKINIFFCSYRLFFIPGQTVQQSENKKNNNLKSYYVNVRSTYKKFKEIRSAYFISSSKTFSRTQKFFF